MTDVARVREALELALRFEEAPDIAEVLRDGVAALTALEAELADANSPDRHDLCVPHDEHEALRAKVTALEQECNRWAAAYREAIENPATATGTTPPQET